MSNETPIQESSPAIAAAKPPRSTFVTVVAWVFVCLGAAFALISGAELVGVLLLSEKTIQTAVNNSNALAHMPAYNRFFIDHMALTLGLSLAGLLLLFVTAIALLKRKRWARPAMIVLLSLAVIRYIVAVTMQLLYFSPASIPAPPNASETEAATYHTMMTAVMYGTALFSIAIAAVFVWIIVRLLSPAIKAEFGMAYASSTPDSAPPHAG
ncbi:MAG TPA: hypothetical protein VKC56_04100 [Gallionellaceae bacterium]|nr:hypothetical protein [Gallionellaceae bacterium]